MTHHDNMLPVPTEQSTAYTENSQEHVQSLFTSSGNKLSNNTTFVRLLNESRCLCWQKLGDDSLHYQPACKYRPAVYSLMHLESIFFLIKRFFFGKCA